MEYFDFEERDFMSCCGSTIFAKEMILRSPFSSFEEALSAAKDIWFNKVNVNGWLEAFAAHPQIGESPAPISQNDASAQWSKGEQSAALATATSSTLQELSDWNARYRQKFGFVFLICASGRSTPEILSELKKRYLNRPIVEFELAAHEQMSVTEIRLAKLFSSKAKDASMSAQCPEAIVSKAGDRVSRIGAHLTGTSGAAAEKIGQIPMRTRPPITTHVLNVALGSPAAGVEVLLEMWKGNEHRPLFGEANGGGGWVFQGSSTTDKDGRSGQLMSIVDVVHPGTYRISFNTVKYCPTGFFPYVSIVFEIRESQKWEHFHVPLLLSPFSFTTYRGS
ncbi:uric acid degradation bifunctional protein TTL isoform X2 [Malania oleifera]|uniref:uric acid degradation bifunctional protein TTL isoform X2 n=1 Tax=Malania oleifera TaxID=397392 RepID=UPI0025ADC4E9|nr:uric acid degradation bifunctional protein TTL isoform X2 [Malania oleifera]